MIVAEYDDENIIEEYITNFNQITSEQYDFSNRNNVGYYCIIYVPNGKSLILGESEREYNAKYLEHNPIHNYVRCENNTILAILLFSKTFCDNNSLTDFKLKNRKAVFCFLYVTRETII